MSRLIVIAALVSVLIICCQADPLPPCYPLSDLQRNMVAQLREEILKKVLLQPGHGVIGQCVSAIPQQNPDETLFIFRVTFPDDDQRQGIAEVFSPGRNHPPFVTKVAIS